MAIPKSVQNLKLCYAFKGYKQKVEDCFTVTTANEFYIEDNHGKHYECVTSTGVIIVKGLDKKTVVTMYIARHGQIKRLYGDRPIPRGLAVVIKRNEKKKLYEISG